MAQHASALKSVTETTEVIQPETGRGGGRKQAVFWVGGSKGGVGKSMVSAALIDFYLEKQQKVLLIECDTANPDVYKAYKEHVQQSELVDLDESDGWIHLVNVCDATPESVVVVNTAARNNLAVARFGPTLQGSLEELGRPLIALWVINRQRDSLELLKGFSEVIPGATMHVIRNGYFGAEAKFELYNGSNTRATIESKGGKSVTFPDLADRVADELYTKRLAISDAAKKLPLGNRAELSRWKLEANRVLSELVT